MKHADSTGSDSEDEVKLEDVPVTVIEGSRAKDPRSKAKYNLFSRLLLWYVRDSVFNRVLHPMYSHILPPSSWVDPLFWLGCRRDLEQTDLYTHPSEAASEKLLKTFNRYGILYLVLEFGELGPPLFLHL